MNLTDGQKWFILAILGWCFLYFFTMFVVQSFSTEETVYKTPEEIKINAYHDCIAQASYFSFSSEVKAISQCETIYGK